MTTKVGELKAAPYNPRKISASELKALGDSLGVFGDLGIITVNRKTGNMVSGHQRIKTLDASWPIILSTEELTEGDKKVGTVAVGFILTPFGRLAYREVDWELKTEQAANIAANNPAGQWDDAALKAILVDLDDGSGLIELSGFSNTDLEGLLDRQPPAPTPSEAEVMFEQISFVVTKEQLSAIGFALDKATKAGDFGDTGNQNARGNALARICEMYQGGK